VTCAQRLGDDDVERPAQRVGLGEAEYALGAPVPEPYGALGIADDDLIP